MLEGRLHAHGGVVHQRIDAAEAPYRVFDHRCDRARVGSVGDMQRRFAARLLDHGDRFLGLRTRSLCIHHDRRTARSERARDGAADIARATGHQRDFSGKFITWFHSDAGHATPSG